MESQHLNQTNKIDMKIKRLSDAEIRSFLKETPSKSELPFRLFPSSYGQVDIDGIGRKIFYRYFESIDPKTKIDTICNLFSFCYQLKSNPSIIQTASSISNYNYEGKNYEDENNQDEKFLSVINNYIIGSYNSWLFATIARFMESHLDSFSIEQLLWSFCSEYFEDNDLKIISSSYEKDFNIELEVDNKHNFPYKIGVPIKAQIHINIDEANFTDCVEVSILHFFYMTQPKEIDQIMSYWDELNSPMKEKVKDFFKFYQGTKRANNDNPSIRQIWATIVSKIPGQVYKKKSNSSLSYYDVELKAGWFNYLKVIAYLKNDKKIHDELFKMCNILTDSNKITPDIKKMTCDCFIKLAGKNLKSAEWIDGHEYEGICDMENGSLDLLGTIKCTFYDVPEPIGFVMLDGHGFVDWMKNI